VSEPRSGGISCWEKITHETNSQFVSCVIFHGYRTAAAARLGYFFDLQARNAVDDLHNVE